MECECEIKRGIYIREKKVFSILKYMNDRVTGCAADTTICYRPIRLVGTGLHHSRTSTFTGQRKLQKSHEIRSHEIRYELHNTVRW